MTNVYIIDDHPAIIEGLKWMLDDIEENVKVVGSSLTLNNALSELSNNIVDVLLLDLFLDDADPVDNVRKIKMSFPALPIAIYTCETSKYWMIRMFKEGISAYLVKSEDEQRIIHCLTQAKNKSLQIPPDIVPFINSMISETDFDISWEEICIVKDLAFGIPIKVIAGKLKKSASSIEKSILKLRRRIRAKSPAELVRIFIQQKWL